MATNLRAPRLNMLSETVVKLRENRF